MASRLSHAWLNLSRALDAGLSRCEPQPPEIQPELASLRAALSHAVVRADFEGKPQRNYSAILADTIDPNRDDAFAGVCAAVAEVRDHLPWVYHYAPRGGEPALAERIAFAELIGPDGPMMSPLVRVGLTLIASHTVYPMHAHPAVELYWVISGQARWVTPRQDRIAPPGDFVLHRSNESHSMSTAEEPLLALWGWSGDIDTPARYT
jgi:mannose-6-phosphate isomerase-like protein (cupin superfamily)